MLVALYQIYQLHVRVLKGWPGGSAGAVPAHLQNWFPGGYPKGGLLLWFAVTAAGILVVEAGPAGQSALEGHPGVCGLGRTAHQRTTNRAHMVS